MLSDKLCTVWIKSLLFGKKRLLKFILLALLKLMTLSEILRIRILQPFIDNVEQQSISKPFSERKLFAEGSVVKGLDVRNVTSSFQMQPVYKDLNLGVM